MKTKTKKCIDCGSSDIKERRRCGDCALKYNRKRVKERYDILKKQGVKRIRYGEIKCAICGVDMIKNRPNQIAHGKCKKKKSVDYNKYPRDNSGKMMPARRIFINLGIKLDKNVIHHIDENPMNNSFDNLMIMSVSNHGSIHSFIREQWVINKGIYGEKLDSKWKKILIKLNFIWIKKQNKELISININSNLSSIKIDNDKIYMIENAGMAKLAYTHQI